MTLKPWDKFDIAAANLNCIYLWGPPGVGKTHAAQGAANGRGFLSLTLNEDVVLQELLGHYIPKGGEFVWHDGPLAIAIRQGQLIVVNELQRASAAVKDAMLGVLDSSSVRSIPLPTGEVLIPGEGFKVIATSNSDVDELDPALADRFECIIKVDGPHPGLVKALNEKAPGLGDLVARSYSDRSRRLSPRSALTLCMLMAAGVALDQALQISFDKRAEDVGALLKVGAPVAVTAWRGGKGGGSKKASRRSRRRRG